MIYDKLIIGAGVAAFGYLDALKANQKNKIGIIDGKRILGSCSESSTSVVSLSGIEENVSPLGDLLYRSFFKADSFFKIHKPDGVDYGKKIYLSANDVEQKILLERHKNPIWISSFNGLSFNQQSFIVEDAYIIDPISFLSWWEKRLSLKFNPSFITDTVIGYQKLESNLFEVELHSKKRLKARQLILASGAGSTYVPLHDKTLRKLKIGHFVKWSLPEIDVDSFCLSYKQNNLVWRKSSKELLLSVQDNDEGILLAEKENFWHLYQLFLSYCSWMPRLEKGEVIVGSRSKGKKRMPLACELEKGVFYIGDFYKNGYSFCFELGEQLVKLTD